MARLSISLLGAFQATLDDAPLHDFESDKGRALLAYLAVEAEQPHRREALAGLLWPDTAESTARANLRRVLSNVRRVIGDRDSDAPFLLVTRQSLQLDQSQDVWVDVAEFRSGVVREHGRSPAIHELEEAVSLYNGPFLTGFSLPDSAPFEEWVRLTGEALQQHAIAALLRLARHYESEGEYAAGLPHARRLLQLDPYAEAAHRQMMRLLALSGRRSEALAQYNACRQILGDELGVEPTEETQALADRIRAGDFSPGAVPQEARRAIRGYELRQHLGRGSFGSVYRAYQSVIGRDVAIKVILPQYVNQPAFIRRFEVEAQLVARLEHPHIVPLYDYWREPDGAYLVMRWLRAGSLRDALQRGPWHPETAIRLVDQIAAALAAAHRQGVIHRDVKPGNILLDEEDNAYLSDFGIATLIEPLIGPLAAVGEEIALPADEGLTGTPEYVSPEMVQGAAVTPRADIYSLGVVLYELLTGGHPFPDLTLAALLEHHLSHPLPSVHTRRPDLPPAVDEVIQIATAKDPDGRYPDALSLAEAFRRALQPESVTVVPAAAIAESDAPVSNPYLGLRPFREADAANFFGREALIRTLVERLRDGRFLAAVGPSGGGKSSVVRAGLIPALQQQPGALPGSENWFVTQMTPGAHPLEELETALLRVAVNPPSSLLVQLEADRRGLLRAVKRSLPDDEGELLLVIDQFEELFSQTGDEAARAFFLDSLTTAVTDPGSRLRLVITLRADFYDRPLQYNNFGRLLRAGQEMVLPLTPGELTAAITRPARRAGLAVDPDLVPAMIADLQRQPGVLPLLQYTLTELVEQRSDNALTLADYREMGGVAGALSRRAESLFSDLNETEQEAARQLFSRLVALGDDETITRRRAPYAELLALAPEEDTAAKVMEQYGRYRLLTFDHDPASRAPTVEIAHEALLEAWPRLRRWLDEGRADLRLGRLLAAAAAEWEGVDRDPGFLLRGTRLDQFAEWAERASLAMTPGEEAYLEASLAARRGRETAEAARREREAALERRSRRRLRALVGVLLVATAVAIGLTLFAFNQNRVAQAEARGATARELAAAAVRDLDVDPERSVLLAMHAISETVEAGETAVPEAVDALHQSITRLRLRYTLPDTGSPACTSAIWCSDVAYSPDGALLVTTGINGRARVWDAETGALLLTLTGHDGPVIGVAFHPQGSHVATAGADGTAALWPIADLLAAGEIESAAPATIFAGHDGNVVDMTFSSDGALLATAGRDDTARVWDVAGGETVMIFTGHESSVRAVAFSADGEFLVTGSSDATVRIWDLETGETVAVLAGHERNVYDIALSSDETLLASASSDGTVKLWALSEEGEMVAAGEPRTIVAGDHGGFVYGVAFSPDGTLLATGGVDGAVRLWDVAGGEEVHVFTEPEADVERVAFSPNGRWLAAAGLDGVTRLFDVAGRQQVSVLAGHEGWVPGLAFSAGGDRLATIGDDRQVLLWDVSDAADPQLSLTLSGHQGDVWGAAFSPDGDTLATISFDGIVKLWDVGEYEVEPDSRERFRWGRGMTGGRWHLVRTAVFWRRPAAAGWCAFTSPPSRT